MAYIANKPVRFDRDYRIGEVIPEDVIAPSMRSKLVEMGKILRIDLPHGSGAGETTEQPQNGQKDDAESAPVGVSSTEGANTQAKDEPTQDGAESGDCGQDNAPANDGSDVPASAEFACAVCGRTFSSQQALAAHSRSHKD